MCPLKTGTLKLAVDEVLVTNAYLLTTSLIISSLMHAISKDLIPQCSHSYNCLSSSRFVLLGLAKKLLSSFPLKHSFL